MIQTKTLLITNGEEIKEAEKLGCSSPEPIEEFFEFWFKPKDIMMAYVNEAGNINITFYNGDWHTVPNDEKMRKLLSDFE